MFDALTVAALTDQLSREIEFGRIQQVGLVSRQAVWFEIFANRRRVYLVASAENQAPAVYLTDREPVADRQLVTPLLLLLRKFARSGRVVSVQQPPLERVISLTFSAPKVRPLAPPGPETASDFEDEDIVDTEDEAEAVFTHLHCEIMGRHSNLILVDDDGLIMDSAKRVTPAMSRVRPILPRRAYSPPPPRIARDPRRATETEVASIVQASSSRRGLIRTLPAEFQGMSPQIAEEAVFRAAEDTQIPEPGPLAQAIRHLYEPLLTGAWTPVIYRDSDDAVTAYSAQPMRHLAANYREEEVETISRAIEAGEGGEFEARAGRHSVRSGRLAASINDAIERLSNKLDALEAEEIRHGDREQFREWGELIFGYLWQIRPGDTELVVGDMRIPLDPGLDAKEQAQRYLQQYRDGKSADRQIGTARAAAELERDYLVQLRTLAEQATSIQDIEDLESEWRTRDPKGSDGRPARRTSGKKRTVPVLEVKGQAIFVGRSGAENDRVTFDIASPDDTWLHARGVPGSHVVVRWTGSDRDDDAVLLRAAELAAYFSQSRTSGRVEVDITDRRYVRKIKGAGPGMVTYRNERTVSVAPVGPD